MTSIDKMQIRGIRSFSPNMVQTIEFYKPLTLIVGKNGSGKTTIIESLKCGSTGDLPPNCKNGQAFIHDPKILGTNEVKAQIKMRFTSVAGKPVVCTRSFSLVQKQSKMEYKAFEAALSCQDENGNKQALSYRCADLNRLVPELMGVSTAVLENVIFVHQEDSCWPLSDDATLKKKFDDIFAATQYTKALEEIRKYKNTKKQEEKNLGLELATFEEQLGTANRLREQVQACEAAVAELKEVLNRCQAKIREAEARLPELNNNRAHKAKLMAELTEVRTQFRQSRDMLASKRKTLQEVYKSELSESSEALEATLTTVDNYLRRQAEQAQSFQEKLSAGESDKERDQQAMYAAKSRLEAARAQLNQHQAAEREAETLLINLGARYELHRVGETETTKKVGAALDVVKGALRARQEELAKAKLAAQDRVGVLMARKEEARVKVDGTGAEIDKKQKEARELQRREAELSEKLDEMQGDDIRLKRVKDDLLKARTDQETQTQESGASSEADDLRRCKDKLKQLQYQFGVLMEEMAKVDAEHEKLQKVESQKAQLADAEEKLQAAIRENRVRICNVLGEGTDVMQMLEDTQLAKKCGEVRRTRETERQSVQVHLADLEKKLHKVDAKVGSQNQELKRLDDEQAAAEERVRVVNPDWLHEDFDFDARRREAEGEAEQLRSQGSGGNAAVISFLGESIGYSERKHKCALCSQACGPEHVGNMKRKRDKMQADDAEPPEARAARARVKEEHARKLHRAQDEMRRVGDIKRVDRRAASESLAELRNESSQAKVDVDAARRELEDKEALEKEVQDLRGQVDTLRFIFESYKRLKSDVETAQSAQSGVFGGAARTKAQVTADLQGVQAEREQTQRKVDQLEHALGQREREMQECTARRNKLEVELSKLQAELERRRDLEKQRDELVRKRSALTDEAQSMRQQEAPQRARLKELENELLGLQQEAEREVGKIDAHVGEANRDQATLQISHDGLRKYAQQGHASTLTEQEEQFARAEEAVREAENRMKEMRSKIQEMHKGAQSKDQIKLEIQANLEYRKFSKTVEDQSARMKEKEEQIANIPNSESVDREVAAINKQVEGWRLEMAQANGSLDTVRNRLEGHKKDLRDPKYRHIDDDHRKKMIEVRTVQLAVKDLDNYYKALDRALMKFHGSKMESINKSIKELWNKTYKGPDIDGITIKSEHEGETASGARKQSYRVVMSKGDTELDMRGRCSAGQKVLASLVIRLALAESFCVNCGILALDEPTTNLDTANIESFALALNEIIKSRRQQANFQLIVITHDEDFVQLVGRSENASHYFRVDKRLSDDSHHSSAPHSVIDKFEIGRFG